MSTLYTLGVYYVMAIKVKPLTDTKCSSAKPRDTEYPLHDGDGLYLLVRPSGTKSWQFRYKNKTTRKETKITLGTYPELSLAKAREYRSTYRTMLAEGLDPKEQKGLDKQKNISENTLQNLTIAWLESYSKKKGLSDETKKKRLRKFENHLFPRFKDRLIENVALKELMKVLNDIYEKSPDNAQRIRADLILIYAYALQHGVIETNIARDLNDILDLSTQKKHRPTFQKLDEIPGLIKGIKNDSGHFFTKSCLQIILHTFLRSSEVRYARWDEINFEKKEWYIPAKRDLVSGVKHSDRGTKLGKKEHFVPLSAQVIEILKEVYAYSGHSNHMFPSPYDKNKFLSDAAPNDALRRMGYAQGEICLHGFRALARSSLGEMGLFQKDALERQMSHVESNDTIDAYTHIAGYEEERREMMQVWSDWLEYIEHKKYITPRKYADLLRSRFKEKKNEAFLVE